MNKNFSLNLQRNGWTFAIIGWLGILVLMVANNFDIFALMVWVVVVPFTVLIVLLHFYYLIPFLPRQKFWSKKYFANLVPGLLLLTFIAALFTSLIWPGWAQFFPLYILLLVYAFFFAVPLSWYIYKNHYDKVFLLTQLGSSQANLTLLRSQINPHFLFNTLNSLYGTALQENAERTGEGIQKLGDMMRFMLYENNLDKISLAREVNYLNNYIDLQKLRIAHSPQIIIETQIEESLNNLQIAPMLLIPFVENAFKHGISLSEPSFVKISLQVLESRVFFSVNNSVHSRRDSDPERQEGGIGLENVKQRLAMLYPGRHELVIRANANEYFVHLTLTL
jgi:hypothetical protein